jgi:DNA primase catalytic subunit
MLSAQVDETALHAIATLKSHYPFRERSFASERQRSPDDQIYMQRNLSFATVADLTQWLSNQRDLVSFHIEAIKLAGDSELFRELVFDIDVTDYAKHCACDCSETKRACSKCWVFIRLAMHCLNYAFTKSFSIAQSDIYWFFSGNRGVHCFILDEEFAFREADMRETFAEYLTFDPAITITRDQLVLLPFIREFYAQEIYPLHANKLPHPEGLDNAQLLQICWPKIDAGVTKAVNHLIRCPYTRNQKSGYYSQRIYHENGLINYVPAALTAFPK